LAQSHDASRGEDPYGEGGDQAGVTWPLAPIVDGTGRLWAIDFDSVAKTTTVRRLDDVPGS
jgi:hypothetical protein